jgi:glycosyltransferase involved in cell wall biosynthesis
MDFSMAKEGFPSKIFTIMACGKPILISSPKDSPIIDFLQDKNCSFNFSNPNIEENTKQMANTLSDMSFNKTKLEVMGSSGLKIIQEKYTKEYISNQYMQLFDDLSA